MSDNNVTIIGAGFVSAGQYDKISINGTSTLSGEIIAESININGMGKSTGVVKAQKVEVNGVYNGSELRASKVIIRGLADLSGNLESEQFELNGSIKCRSINADSVEIKLKGHINVKELVGSRISVRVKEPSFTLFNVQVKPSVLNAQLIEADEIFLEHTEADVVSGSVVQIGKGCRIGRVEYKESLKVSNEANVGQIVKD